ncbi:UNVERIFIED_ORG: DedA family protein [Bacillus sp. AZ43]
MNRLPRRVWVRVLAVLVLLVVGTAVALSAELPSVAGMRTWLDEGGSVRWVAMVVGVAVALLTPISRTALSVLVGAVAGFPAGLAVALSGGLLGGLAGFALSRWLGREVMTRLPGARLARLDRVVSERGFVSVLVARIMPVPPFVFVSYAAGLSGVRLGPYLLGTAVGLVPWSVLYVGVGASVTRIDSWTSLVDVVPALAVVVLLALLAGFFWWRRRRRLPTQPDSGPSATVADTLGRGDDTSSAQPAPERGA